MANQKLSESIKIFVNKNATAFMIAVNIALCLLWLFITAAATYKFMYKTYPTKWHIVLATAALFIIYLVLLYLILRIINYSLRYFQKDPELIVTVDGLNFYRYEFIPWSNIKSITKQYGPGKALRQEYIVIYLNRTLEHLSFLNRLILSICGKIWVYPYLSMPLEELYDLLHKHMGENKIVEK